MNESRRERREKARSARHVRVAVPACPAKLPWFIGLFATFVIGAAITFAATRHFYGGLVPPSVQRISTVHGGLTLGHLLEMTPEELSKMDLAEMNLLCAKDLPGEANFDIVACLAKLDDWADHVDLETRRNRHRFTDNPEQYHNSEVEFRMGMLITVLQQDMGISYNPDLIAFSKPNQHGPEVDKAFLTNPGNIFLVELLNRRTGSCASMPVLYAAIGRRLGYPLKLSNAKDHLFVRWDRGDGTGYVDFEGTGHGYIIRTDDDFKKWPDAISDEEIKTGQYLKSLTPSEELSTFMAMRGGALLYHQKMPDALVAYAHAIRLWPQCRELRPYLGYVANKVAEQNTIRIINVPASQTSSYDLIPNPEPAIPVPGMGYSEPIESIRFFQREYPGVDWYLINQKNHTTKKTP